jgi:hypothetical protein
VSARRKARHLGRPYALPRVFDASTVSGADLETYCRAVIRAAWAAPRRGRWDTAAMKAARELIADLRLTPATIAALACSLADYNRRVWPRRETAGRLDWLYAGSGCCERSGTEYDAHIGAWSALAAVMSILVDVPLEHPEDAEALLSTLIYTGWRHVPARQQARTARRLSRYVSDELMGNPFAPIGTP